ncbi:hypothetical protein IFM89_008227 [Coptis chinensis]|uniref:Uncharacterized protein n=1 Tax=Coptis chinensis TaxID=261450 RepID=A0A835IAV5_9MAGN|nr:hypothetical protein IFM89_008227 [Coptis chinensis]
MLPKEFGIAPNYYLTIIIAAIIIEDENQGEEEVAIPYPEEEEQKVETEEDVLVNKAQEFMTKIISSQLNLSLELIHAFASMLETEESRKDLGVEEEFFQRYLVKKKVAHITADMISLSNRVVVLLADDDGSGQIVTTDHLEELIQVRINSSFNGSEAIQKFPYVIFCAPPSRSAYYPGDVRVLIWYHGASMVPSLDLGAVTARD